MARLNYYIINVNFGKILLKCKAFSCISDQNGTNMQGFSLMFFFVSLLKQNLKKMQGLMDLQCVLGQNVIQMQGLMLCDFSCILEQNLIKMQGLIKPFDFFCAF